MYPQPQSRIVSPTPHDHRVFHQDPPLRHASPSPAAVNHNGGTPRFGFENATAALLSSSSSVGVGADRSGSEGLTNVAAQFESLHPMYRAMRDLEARKDTEISELRAQVAQRDDEIRRLRRQLVETTPQSSLPGGISGAKTRQAQMNAMLGMQQDESEHLNVSGSQLATTATTATTTTTTTTMSSSGSGLGGTPLQASRTPNMQQQQQSAAASMAVKSAPHRQTEAEHRELEAMLSRSIAGLAEAERALASERSRFLVVDPGLIPLERWTAAVARLGDLHDEVAHRRFGACLAAARLSGQVPDDVAQVGAAQYLRSALSPILLQHLRNCFQARTREAEDESVFADPWRRAERLLAEEPDMLLHHVNAVLERLVIDPADEFAQ